MISAIGTEIGWDSLPIADEGKALFQNVAIMVIPTGGTGEAVLITDEAAITPSRPFPCRLSQVTNPAVTSSGVTWMLRVALALVPAVFVAVSTNVSVAGPGGAMKSGFNVVLLFKRTTDPAVCFQSNVAPLDTTPLMATELPAITLTGALMLTLGGSALGFTTTVTVALVVSGTVLRAATLNVSVVGVVTLGAVNVAASLLALVIATAGQPICVQV